MADSEPTVAFDPLVRLLGGYELTQIVATFVEVGAADALAAGPRTCDELADELALDAGALGRLLRALTVLRLVARKDDGTYKLTSRGERLAASAPRSVAPLAAAAAAPWWWSAWGQLAASVRTGKSAFEEEHAGIYGFLESEPAAASTYHDYMTAFRREELDDVVNELDVASVHYVIDIGGGHGALLNALLSAHTHLRGTLFERPHAVEAAKLNFAAAGLDDRAHAVVGDFFVEIPPGGDLYIMRGVVHDWDDDRVTELLGRLRAAVPAHARLVLVQHIVGENAGSERAAFIDIALLALTGGRERTEAEYRELLTRASFSIVALRALPSGPHMIEAVPA